MSVFGWIEEIYAIITYKKQIEKLQLEIQDLEKNKSLIKQPSDEEIREYDQKRKELEKKIETMEQISIQKRQLFVSIATLAVASAAVVVSVLVGRSVVVVKSDVAEVGERVESVEKNVLARQFRITGPSDSDSVNMIESIKGETPFWGMHHYVIVTPEKARIDFVEEEAKVSPGGLWSGQAVFGEATAGAGEKFVVRALATDSTLSRGPLLEVPKDALFSESITVTRKK